MQKHPLMPSNPMTIVWLLLILCLSITFRVWILAKNSAEQNTQTIFSLYSEQVQLLIQERFKGYEQLLRGTAGVFDDNDITDDGWQNYVQNTKILTSFPEIRLLGFAPYHTVVPEKPKTPINFIAPKIALTHTLLGRNLSFGLHTSYPGKPYNTSITMGPYGFFDQFPQLQKGFLLSLPVYPPFENLSNLHGTNQFNPSGYVFAWINAQQLIAEVATNHLVGVAVQIFDTGASDKSQADELIYQSMEYDTASQNLTSRSTLNLFNHVWLVEFTALPDLENQPKTVNALIWVTGILFSFAIFAINKAIVDYNRLLALQQSHENLKTNELRLKYEATHDLLTDLYNRQALEDRFSQASRYADEDHKQIAVAFIDLDDFKKINDTYGHDYGDEYLKAFAHRLSLGIRNIDTAARIGGDEFIILLSNQKDQKETTTLIQRILQDIDQDFSFNGYTTQVRCSIGISIYSQDGTTLETLLKQADTAMYLAKKMGKNQFQYYESDLT